MTSAPAGQATGRLSASTVVRRTLARRPEAWVYAGAAGAGVLLLVGASLASLLTRPPSKRRPGARQGRHGWDGC